MKWLMKNPYSSSLVHTEEDPIFLFNREINRAFDNILADGSNGTAKKTVSPRVDVKEDDKAYNLTAELPGMDEKDIELTFDDGVLTLSGEKKVERNEQKDTWHMVERSYGHFARQLSLPVSVDAEKIEAKFDKGILTVVLPKLTEVDVKAKKIAINT